VKERAILILLLSLILSIRAGASDRWDYLTRGEREKDTYDKAVRRILWQAWNKDVVLRHVHFPPFEKELIIGIRRAGTSYRAFVLEPSSSIWSREESRYRGQRPNFSGIQAIYKERPISEPFVRRAAALWRYVLADQANYHVADSGLDSSELYFFLGFLPSEHLAAHTSNLGPKSEQLVYVANDLSAFVYPAKVNEAKMYQWLRQSEKKVGIKSWVVLRGTSNHAIQRTAGRSAFQLSMTSTFNPQPRTLSPAVADLRSR
jgi:hypothetical protein